MEGRTVRIGIRPSPLALKQAQEVMPVLGKIYPGAAFAICRFDTPGDRDKTTPLSGAEGSDFFTREIDEALRSGAIDVAVHSSKDLPDPLPEGLALLFETGPFSPYDALVSRGGLQLSQLPPGARIGASSVRRKEAIRFLRPDLAIVDIRGNIEERLSLIDQGKVDAVVVAHAALIRLGLEHKASEVFPLDVFPAHPRQGRLAIVTRVEKAP